MDGIENPGDSPAVAGPPMLRNSRQHRRAFIELSVATRASPRPALTHNISIGGTFIKTESPLPVGARLHFKLELPTAETPLDLAGEVVWATSKGKHPGMGVKFVHASEAQRVLVESSVNRLLTVLLGRA